MRTFILGAGFAGMSAGIRTGTTIYEASSQAGGICNSYEKDGFQFFNGGPHLLFGQGPGLDYIKSLVPVNEYEKLAGVYYNHIFPYPIQTSLQQEFTPRNEWAPESIKEWLFYKFGKEQCNLFFFPFNEKYTAGLYDQVIQADGYKTPKSGSQGWVNTFCDPVNGLDDLVSKMASQCDIRYNMRAVSIIPEDKAVLFEDGTEVNYDRLISTIPLSNLLKICGNFDFNLPHTSVLVINIGAERDLMTPKEHWLYVPFCKTNFHRISFYSNIDHTKAPGGKVNLSVEMAFMPEMIDELDLDYICHHVVRELQAWRMIGKTIVVDPTIVKCGYTWLHNKEDRANGLAWLKERDIISTGRYGKHQFQGIIQSIEDGFSL